MDYEANRFYTWNERRELQRRASAPFHPKIFDSNPVFTLGTQRADVVEASSQFSVDYIRRIGLIRSTNNTILADNPDGIGVLSTSSGSFLTTAIEVKTMASLKTLEDARNIASKFSRLIHIETIGECDQSTEVFRAAIPKSSYRLPCLHHALVTRAAIVHYVVAKGSSQGVGQIIYGFLLDFSPSFKAQYEFCLT